VSENAFDETRRTIVIRAAMDERAANEVIAQLLFLDAEDPSAPAHVQIDSDGGEVVHWLAVCDAFDAIRPPVHTRCTRVATGMAVFLLAHGTKGCRSATSRARMTLTPLESREPKDREAAAREIARAEGVIVEMLARDAGRSVETVRHDLHRFRTFRARETLAYGLVDAIRD